MKIISLLLLCLFLLGNISISSAHALFIKTESTGTKGQSHEVTIFYAEPADGKKENLADWWSNTKEFSLWLIQPDGSKEQLEATANDNHFTASFNPAASGTYQLAIYHDVAQTFDATQYQFNASATVNVSDAASKNSKDHSEGMFMSVSSEKNTVNGNFELTVGENGKPLANLPVTFFAPNGWSKTLTTNEQGSVKFTPLWEGDYLVETYKVDEVENEADFNKKHRIVTTVLKVEQ